MTTHHCPVRTNSLRAWVLAARPKTLAVSAAPVIVAVASAWADTGACPGEAAHSIHALPAALCLLFALVMQIDANLVNDYFDFARGIDNEQRLGPERACAQGWIEPDAMRRGIALTTVAACLVGLPLALYGGVAMVLVGVLCVAFCFLYTTTLAHKGLGDVLVVLFFGLVPVAATYYILLHRLTPLVLLLALACGLVVDTLLLVNNYRDRDTDRAVGKKTLVVRIGARRAEWLYLALGAVGVLLCLPLLRTGRPAAALLPALYLIPHVRTWRTMVAIGRGRELNRILGLSSRNILWFALLLSIGQILSFIL